MIKRVFSTVIALVLGGLLEAQGGTKVDILGPAGSGPFGSNITVLSNGNLVVIDTGFDLSGPTVTDVGAVYLYDPDGNLISRLRGSTSGDAIGSSGIRELSNGHFVVISPNWDNGGVVDAGAVTWGSADTGFIGGADVVVSAANSLVGSASGDRVGSNGIRALGNGNYVVNSPLCANGSIQRAGASTWGNGETGTFGVVSVANSLMGGTFQDSVGTTLRELSNSNYVIQTGSWTNPTTGAANAGAVTWASGTGGTVGVVSETNSLVGTTVDDSVGGESSGNGIVNLANGNYVVRSPGWDSPTVVNAGAVTWCNGATGTVGPVTTANSLHGTTANDLVGSRLVESLTNGNYVVGSPNWDNGTVVDVGAATWGNGATGTTGPVTPANSIIGSTAGDLVSTTDIDRLDNGNYVVISPTWDNGTVVNAGAVTFARGNAPTSLVVGPANSLVGSTAEDQIGSGGMRRLIGGGYVVQSPFWDNAAVVNAGAATWGSGTAGVKGVVSAANSLIGSHANDGVGNQVAGLINGNYLVLTASWNAAAGAVTWGNGRTGVRGVVSASNSLVGSTAGDQIGSAGVTQLINGNYVVRSPSWNGGIGAATWGRGTSGVKGAVSAANSLVGGVAGDGVGSSVVGLLNGHYVVLSPNWDKPSPAVVNAGAATWGNGSTGIRGLVTTANSLTGTSPEDAVGTNAVGLSNGSFVVGSPSWDFPLLSLTNVGAATWADGTGPIVGEISLQNSLIGGTNEDRVSQFGITATSDGRYIISSPSFDNGMVADAGAVSLGNGQIGTTGFVSAINSVLGTVASQGNTHVSVYDPIFEQLFVGRRASQLVTIFVEGAVVSLARTRDAADLTDRAFGAFGSASVNGVGGVLFDTALSGSASGNRALYGAVNPQSPIDLVLQKGQDVSALGFGLPANARVASVSGQITQQSELGVFQATLTGTGVNASNNRLVMADTAAGVGALLRTGTPVSVLGGAATSRVVEVVQSYNSDLLVLSYNLRAGGTPAVTTKTDSGLLLMNHAGTAAANVAAREGSPAFGGGGVFGAIAGRAAVLGNEIHFPALFQPTTGRAVQALFATTVDGAITSRVVTVGDNADGVTGATYASFPASTQLSGQALFRGTLRGVPVARNEGLWIEGGDEPLVVKGGLVIPDSPLLCSRILRFWPAGASSLIVQMQVSGPGVNASNNQVLVLIQEDNTRLLLMRTGFPAAGTGAATVRSISAVDVNPVSGAYAILGTLRGAPTATNQALWSGFANAGNAAALQVLRLPVLRLRKGQSYSTATTMGTVRSLSFKPAVDAAGAGGRGLSHAVGANGAIVVSLIGDLRVTDLVLLP
jgi:hypothetical protein